MIAAPEGALSIADVSAGYVMDTSYADTFFRELSPAWLNYVAALNGASPRDLKQPFTYLELGCGLGTSSVVHAAANPAGEFHACDFNAQHIENGRRLATLYGADNVVFHESSFEELSNQPLACDFIVLHGAYSWVGARARAAILDILRDKLKPGGLVYLSYNCYPGWTVEVPLRKLLVELASSAPAGSTARRIEHALARAKELTALRYFKANPGAGAALQAYARGSLNYLAHEFFNDTWEPFYSVDVAAELGGLGLDLLGSATLVDNHPELCLEQGALDLLAKLESPRVRALAADFATNQRFRRDVFIAGQVARRPAEIAGHLAATPLATLHDPRALPRTIKVPRGEIRFQEAFVRELAAAVSGGVKTLGQLSAELARGAHPASEVVRNLVFMTAAGALVPAAEPYVPAAKPAAALRFAPELARVLAHATEQWVSCALASRVLGHGFIVAPGEALALSLCAQGARDANALARRLLEEAGRRGRALLEREPGQDTPLAQQAEMQAKRTLETLAPALRRLGLAE